MEPKEKKAFEPSGLVPRSIVRTFERFRQQLLPGSETAAIREYRISRYQVLVSARCLFTLLTIPIATNWLVSSWILSPLIEHFWNTQQNEIFLNSYQEERAFAELEFFSEKLFFESLLNKMGTFAIQNQPSSWESTCIPLPPCSSHTEVHLLPSESEDMASGAALQNPSIPKVASPEKVMDCSTRPQVVMIEHKPYVKDLTTTYTLPTSQAPIYVHTLRVSKTAGSCGFAAVSHNNDIPKLPVVPQDYQLCNPFDEAQRRKQAPRSLLSTYEVPRRGHSRGVLLTAGMTELMLSKPTEIKATITTFGGTGLHGVSSKGVGHKNHVQDLFFYPLSSISFVNTAFADPSGLPSNISSTKLIYIPKGYFVKQIDLSTDSKGQSIEHKCATPSVPFGSASPFAYLGDGSLPADPPYPSYPYGVFASQEQALLLSFLPREWKEYEGSCGSYLRYGSEGSPSNWKQWALSSQFEKKPVVGNTDNNGIEGNQSPSALLTQCETKGYLLFKTAGTLGDCISLPTDANGMQNSPYATLISSEPFGVAQRKEFTAPISLAYHGLRSTALLGQECQANSLGLEIDSVKIKEKVQEKILELAIYYNQQTILSITNVIGDFVSIFTLGFLFVWMKPEIAILKSFLIEAIYSLSDTTKSFLLILLTDLLVGFHSPRGWETALELLLKHFGLPENQDFVFLFVATFPVLLDTVFKYWIFRHLNKISPSTVATYHSMIE